MELMQLVKRITYDAHFVSVTVHHNDKKTKGN